MGWIRRLLRLDKDGGEIPLEREKTLAEKAMELAMANDIREGMRSRHPLDPARVGRRPRRKRKKNP